MANGMRVYAGTYDGLQVLRVGGGRCELAAEAFSGALVQALGGCRERAERVFVGLKDGLHHTDDAGLHWRKVLDGDVRSVNLDPTDDRVVYAGTDPVHLYRSEDGGDGWEEITSLQRLPDETHERLGEAAPVDMGTSHQPEFRHRRQDWWFPVPPHQGHVLNTFIHPDDSDLLLLAIEHGGVARSTDRGKTWEDVSVGIDYLDIHVVASMPHRFDRYLLTSARGLYSAVDPTNGWTRAQNGCERDYFHDMVVLPASNGGTPVVVVATAEGSPGFWPSIKARGAWDHSQVGSRAALYRSTDGGESWQRIGAGQGLPAEMTPMIWALCPDPQNPSGLFAGLGESSGVPGPLPRAGGAVLVSDDGGETWQTLRANMAAVEHVHATAE